MLGAYVGVTTVDHVAARHHIWAMARQAPDPALVEAVLELRRSGASTRDIAAEAGISEACVRKWVDKYGEPSLRNRTTAPPGTKERTEARKAAAQAAIAEAQAPSAPPIEDDDTANADLVAECRRQIRELQASANAARAAGNHTAAQRYLRDRANVLTILARAEKDAKIGGDGLTVPKHEIETAKASWRERVKSALNRPLLCAHCSRALSVEWGEGSEAEAASAGDP